MERRRPRYGPLLVALIVAVAVLIYVARTTTPKRPHTAKSKAASAAKKESANERPLRAAAPPGARFDRYALVAARDLFSPPRPPKPPQPSRPMLSVPPAPPSGPPAPPRSPEPRGPDLSGWSYVGYIKVDDKARGMLQNDSGMGYESLSIGESFMGATVTQITADAIVFRSGTRTFTLNRVEDYSLVPLSKAATPTPTPQPPRGPGVPRGARGGPGRGMGGPG